MLKISVIDTGGHRIPVEEGELAIKPKLLAQAEASKQLERIAPDWTVHLYDGAVIDHILKVINSLRTSRAETTRRYRAPPRADSDLALRSVGLQACRRR